MAEINGAAAAPIELFGVDSSPYTVKIRAILRYRHIPYVWRCCFPQFEPALADLAPKLMPVMRYPDGQARIDSTPMALELEEKFPGTRSVRPDDPVLDFFSLIIEDMADEFLTKFLFRYRFDKDGDRQFASKWVMDDTFPALSDRELTEKAATFLDRQISRQGVVGVTEANWPNIDKAFHRLLQAVSPMVARGVFLFGTRPSLGDFGLFGQFYTLTADPTPSALIRAHAPRIEYWVRRLDDASGVDGAWQTDPTPSEAVLRLLRIAGDTYLPLLAENARAAAEGRENYTAYVEGGALTQMTFRYHVKCLDALRTAFAKLGTADRERAETTLQETGCLSFLT